MKHVKRWLTAKGLKISWDNIDNADYYEIWYDVDNSGKLRLIGKVSGDESDFLVKSVSEDEKYRFRIRAVNGDYSGPFVDIMTR